MAGTSNYPGALDNFSAASPTNLGDDDSTGRNHGERHDDLEAAVEAVQGELGINPAGTATTVVARLDGLDSSKAPVANPTFSGVAAFPDGSESAPSVTNDGDTNTGLFFPAADTLAITTGGTERLRVSSAGNVGIGVTPTQRLQVGADAATNVLVQAGGNIPSVILDRAGTSLAAPTTVSVSQPLGAVTFRGHDGSSYQSAAAIVGVADGTVSTGDLPGRVIVQTRPAGGALTERMRIDSNGLITGTGTSLGAWTAYTPTIGGTGWALGDGTATGAYCQIGKVVHFRCRFTLGASSTAGAGGLTLSYPVSISGGLNTTVLLRDASLSQIYLAGATGVSSTTFAPWSIGTDGVMSLITTSTPFTWAASDYVDVSGTYQAA